LYRRDLGLGVADGKSLNLKSRKTVLKEFNDCLKEREQKALNSDAISKFVLTEKRNVETALRATYSREKENVYTALRSMYEPLWELTEDIWKKSFGHLYHLVKSGTRFQFRRIQETDENTDENTDNKSHDGAKTNGATPNGEGVSDRKSVIDPDTRVKSEGKRSHSRRPSEAHLRAKQFVLDQSHDALMELSAKAISEQFNLPVKTIENYIFKAKKNGKRPRNEDRNRPVAAAKASDTKAPGSFTDMLIDEKESEKPMNLLEFEKQWVKRILSAAVRDSDDPITGRDVRSMVCRESHESREP
jgi:hypothetical protein